MHETESIPADNDLIPTEVRVHEVATGTYADLVGQHEADLYVESVRQARLDNIDLMVRAERIGLSALKKQKRHPRLY